MLLQLIMSIHLHCVISTFVVTEMTEVRKLRLYRGYQEVEMHHYTVANQVSLASWEFKANGTSSCSSKKISVHLRYGSFPVINPDNSSFPDLFVLHQLFQYHITLEADMVSTFLNISSPLPGDWFAAAYIDDDSQNIKQKGLFSPCRAWLLSSLKLNVEHPVINLMSNIKLKQNISKPQFYKFSTEWNGWMASIDVRNCNVPAYNSTDCFLTLYARPLALPSINNSSLSNSISQDCSALKICKINIIPSEDKFNYILVHPSSSGIIEFIIELTFTVCETKSLKHSNGVVEESSSTSVDSDNSTIFPLLNQTATTSEQNPIFDQDNAQENSFICWPQVTLARDTKRNYFSFQYIIGESDHFPLLMNVSTFIPTLIKFQIFTVIDIGGTLAVELTLPSFNTFTSNMTVELCLKYGTRPSFNQNGTCLSDLFLSVNTSSKDNHMAAMLIPYPEIGTWYVSISPHCYIEDDNFSSTVIPCDNSNTTIIFNIRSAPCVLNECGKYGNCDICTSGGMIYSSCQCIAGWRGWGCTDNKNAFSNVDLLVSVLLLTLSNIFFLPAIILALHRHYYTEAAVYTTSMFFSTFYHACDSEIYSFCLMRLSVLQFCDFYSAILSIWMTLIAMAKLPPALQSVSHMLGAIGLALGVEYDRTGLLVFVIPAGTGLLILVMSWIQKCYQQRTCHPRKRIWLFCLLPGVLLAASGLIMFAFFETKENYGYIHSSWHATMALSILFLLPERRNHKDSAQEVMQVHWKPHGSFKFLQDNETDML